MTGTVRQVNGLIVGVAALGIAVLAGCAKPEEASPPVSSGAPPATQTTQTPPPNKDNMAMGGSMSMGTSALNALKPLSGKDFDIAYLSQMIAHHQGAVDMARDVLKVAQRPETKTEAQSVITDQEKQIKQMTDWLQKWYGVKPSQAQIDLMKADMAGMMGMKTDDKMFFQMMIPHHQSAIDMSELALKQAGKAEVKTLAQDIITKQGTEISRYNAILKAMP